MVVMINQYVIYGERHSGTKFLNEFIRNHFQVTATQNYGHKHFFSPQHIFRSSKDDLEKTIFICIVRNPYDWLMAFHKERHHCGISNAKNIYRFLSKEWLSRQPLLGPEIMLDRHIYTQKRYKNIFELRNVKNNYLFHLLPRYVPNYIFLKYEDFLDSFYPTKLITYISLRFKIPQRHNIDIKPNNFNNKHFYYDKIDSNLLKYINTNIDWTIENQIGYIKAYSLE